MTDGELLEKAAKSIGLEYVKPAAGYGGEFGLIAGVKTLRSMEDWRGATTWNPLADDGDALRLAVKLGLDVCIDTKLEPEPITYVVGFAEHTSRTFEAAVHHGDPYVATRRAITSAAAEIGKAKCA